MARKFGVELEIIGGQHTQQAVRDIVVAAGVRCEVEGYNHTRRSHWKIVTDGSLSGRNAMELVSPPLRGSKGLRQVCAVARALVRAGVEVNSSCGMHVHVEAGDLTVEQLKNLCKLVTIHEDHFKAILPASRHSTRWAAWPSAHLGGGSVEARVARIDAVRSMSGLLDLWGHDRYRALNLEALSRHTTVEFRAHGGTIDANKIAPWVAIVVGMVRKAAVDYSVKTKWDSGRKRNWFDFRHMGGREHVGYIMERREHFAQAGSTTPAVYGRNVRALRAAA